MGAQNADTRDQRQSKERQVIAVVRNNARKRFDAEKKDSAGQCLHPSSYGNATEISYAREQSDTYITDDFHILNNTENL